MTTETSKTILKDRLLREIYKLNIQIRDLEHKKRELIFKLAEVRSKMTTETSKQINYGCKVWIKFSEKGRFGKSKNKEQTLRNVTEIHYNFPSIINGKEISIAFESDIHGTGLTYDIEDIEEFETSLENKKEVDF